MGLKNTQYFKKLRQAFLIVLVIYISYIIYQQPKHIFSSDTFQGQQKLNQILQSRINNEVNYEHIQQQQLTDTIYFEGWYFKLVDEQQQNQLAVITGIYLNFESNNKQHTHIKGIQEGQTFNHSHAFIMVMLNSHQTNYYQFDLKEFQDLSEDRVSIRLKNNYFSHNKVILDIKQEDFLDANLEIKAHFKFIEQDLWQSTLFKPSILGIFQYLPFLECYHSIISYRHIIQQLKFEVNDINNQNKLLQIDFSNGLGYIEKDYGKNFPTKWIWLQSNNFISNDNKNNLQLTSFFFSVASVPIKNLIEMQGLICTLLLQDQENQQKQLLTFATHTSAFVQEIILDETQEIKNTAIIILYDYIQGYKLEIDIQRGQYGYLYQPQKGVGMKKTCKESTDGIIKIKLYKCTSFFCNNTGNQLIYSGLGNNSGVELEWK